MANAKSPIVQDILFNTTMTMMMDDSNDSLLAAIDILADFDPPTPPLDIHTMNLLEEGESVLESISIDQYLLDFSSDIPDMPSLSSYTPEQQYIHSSDYLSIDQKYEPDISLSFINAPEPFYHVRYLSEITDAPLNGSVVNTRIKTKKNVSGRYLKGIRGRYVTILLPSTLSDCSNLYIRVTRLTVPYQSISFIHPYPLFYSCPKKASNVHVITHGSSIYYKITKEELCSGSKHFPNLILTRRKQCELKRINSLCRFDNSDMYDPFIGNPKTKISVYQLKKSQLDFRVVVRVEQTNTFENTNRFCRSSVLIEAEGSESKKLSE